jgi:hypothetical protein
MEKCPVCTNGKVITKVSSAGDESYCSDCRKIVASATLGFVFTADGISGIEECTLPGDPRPGVKGPGAKARCWLYDPANEGEKELATKKAKDSAYAYQKKQKAAKIINATAGFTGAPSSLMPPAETNPTLSAKPAPAASSSSQDFSVPPQTDIGKATAPGGMQPGDLNSNNPLNSGTTASLRLAELIDEDIRQHMGPGFCTEHSEYDGCNHDEKTY